MNLCTNALQAMEHGGVLEVVLDRTDVAQDRRLSHGHLASGSYVRLCVSDSGTGIPPHVLERMFDPFFTTKGVGEGTGLGLSLVHGIVADLGGAIDVRTAMGAARPSRSGYRLRAKRPSHRLRLLPSCRTARAKS
jgi:signal transduction histidine kinase